MADDAQARIEELEELVASLRAELERVREELRRSRRSDHERPPHWRD
jgi:uncharacterized coiled-coil protein SlyX